MRKAFLSLPKEVIEDEKIKSECKGLFFRLRINNFFLPHKIAFRNDYKLLKSKSCSGCSQCDWMIDDFYNGTQILEDKEIVDGGLYRLGVTNIGRDWETGHVDKYDLILNYIKEKEKNK